MSEAIHIGDAAASVIADLRFRRHVRHLHRSARETSAFRPGMDSAACEARPIPLPFFLKLSLHKLVKWCKM